MLPPPKKVWNRFASKVISKLNRFPRPAEAISRTTRRLLARLGTGDPGGSHRCHCRCHYVVGGHQQPEYRSQVYRSFFNNDDHMQVDHQGEDEGDENGDEGLEFVEDLGAMEDHAVDERAEEFIAKFHESLKLERLQHF